MAYGKFAISSKVREFVKRYLYIDRIIWNAFLATAFNPVEIPLHHHMQLLNQKITEYEIMHKCVIMDVWIADTDPFFAEIKFAIESVL